MYSVGISEWFLSHQLQRCIDRFLKAYRQFRLLCPFPPLIPQGDASRDLRFENSISTHIVIYSLLILSLYRTQRLEETLVNWEI